MRPHVDQAAHHQRRALDGAAGAGEGPDGGPRQAVAHEGAVHRRHVDGVLGDGRGRGDLAALPARPAQLPVARAERIDAPGVVADHHQPVADRRRELQQGPRREAPCRGTTRGPRLHARHEAVTRRPAAVLGALEARVVQGHLGRALPHPHAGGRVGPRVGRDHADPQGQRRAPGGVRGRAGDHGTSPKAVHLHPGHRRPGVPVHHAHDHRRPVEQGRRPSRLVVAPAPAAPGHERQRECRGGQARGCPTRAPHAPRGCLATRTSRSPPRSGRSRPRG